MGSEATESWEATSISSKLPLFSFSGKSKGPTTTASVMTTPPIHTAASVPFQWEEAPGKPRSGTTTDHDQSSKPKSARCLELPPRLLVEAKVASMPSPTTDAAHSVSNCTLPFRKGGSFRSPDDDKKKVVIFGSSRWGSFRNRKQQLLSGHRHRRVSFDFSSADPVVDVGGGGGGGGTEVKITRVKRKGSVFSLSDYQARSHVLTSIYERFKQAVPWRRGQGQGQGRRK